MSKTEHLEIILSFVKKINPGYLNSYDDWMQLEVIGEEVFTYKFEGYTHEDWMNNTRYLTVTEVSVITPETELDWEYLPIDFNETELDLLTSTIGNDYSLN